MIEVEVIGLGTMSQRKALSILTGETFESWDPILQTKAMKIAIDALRREVEKNESAVIVDVEVL